MVKVFNRCYNIRCSVPPFPVYSQVCLSVYSRTRKRQLSVKNIMDSSHRIFRCLRRFCLFPRNKARNIVCLFLVGVVSAPVIGHSITATVGQDVILPCKASNYMPFEVVEWSRDEAELEYVLIFDKNNPDLKIPEQSYKGRVDLVNMEEGDVSLKLSNVKPEDRGRYECYVVRETNRNKRAIQPINTVYLHIAPSPGIQDGNSRSHAGLWMALSLVIVLIVILFIWKKIKTSSPPDDAKEPII